MGKGKSGRVINDDISKFWSEEIKQWKYSLWEEKMKVEEEGNKWAKFASSKGRTFCKVTNLSGVLFTKLSGYKDYHTLISYIHLNNTILSHWDFQTTL